MRKINQRVIWVQHLIPFKGGSTRKNEKREVEKKYIKQIKNMKLSNKLVQIYDRLNGYE